GRHRMSGTIVERIDELDNKQAIFQVKLLLQNIVNSNPQIAALDDAAIAAELKAIDTDTSGAFAEAAEILRTGPTKSLPSKEAGATAREMLRTFAATEDGEAILASSLEKKDVSADLGLITFPLVCTFLWLTVAGGFDVKLGGFHYVKKGLTPDQQA